MSPRNINLRISLISSLLDKARQGILSQITGSLFPTFFDFDDEALDRKIQELEEKEEWFTEDILELAACYFTMYLKAYLEESEGGDND